MIAGHPLKGEAMPDQLSDKVFFVDSTVHVWRDSAESEESLKLMRKLLGVLYRHGWQLGRDPHTDKHYKCIGKYHRRGRRGDLEMKSDSCGRHVEIKFFQNVANVENRNGGEYDFDKLQKMPYLLRLRTQFEMAAIAAEAERLGFKFRRDRKPVDAMDFIRLKREKNPHAGHERIYDYNCKSGDGDLLEDGQFRCFYGYRGHLLGGTIYHNINNMWWVVTNPGGHPENVGSFRLFSWRPGLPRRRPYDPKGSIEGKLSAAVRSEDFERAIGLRDARDRLAIAQ
jgi:hypothetical protein